MSERIKVGLVNQPWGYVEPPITKGGSIPILLYEMARRLTDEFEVTYFTRGKFRRQVKHESNMRFEYIPVAMDKALIRLQGKVKIMPESQLRPFWATDWFHPQYGKRLGVTSRELGCDIIHIINYTQFILPVRKYNPNAKIVMHMQCEWANQLDRAMIEPRLREADMILGCSQYIARRIQEAFPHLADRCRPVWNGVFTDRFKPTDHAERESIKRIIFVGRVAPEKGVHTLIEGFAMLAAANPELHLDIVGPGEIIPPDMQVTICDDPKVLELAPFYEGETYRKHLEALVVKHGLQNRVTFHGPIGHADGLVELYQKADVGIIPSIWDEPFGIPVVEAMASGLPVIVTGVGAFPEIVDNGKYGLVVERANPKAIADAIQKLIDDPALRRRLSSEGRERAITHFSWDGIVNQLRSYYNELTADATVAAR